MWGATMPDACSNAITLIAEGKIGLGEDSNAGVPYVSADMRETNDALEEAIRGLESESPADVAKNSPVMGYQLDDQPDSLRYHDHESKQVKQTDVTVALQGTIGIGLSGARTMMVAYQSTGACRSPL